ncbi:MAG: M28 family peptidase [Bacteroidales bacterium]|nr:M28 family peptidase [Bacteroidales bacterium]
MNPIKLAILVLLGVLVSCGNKSEKSDKTTESNTAQEIVCPMFVGDSAYLFVEQQVAFGPRVPGSDAHKQCRDFLRERFLAYGAEVVVQEGSETLYDGTKLPLYNIIASYNTEATKRIVVCSHWDSRPFADHDPNVEHRNQPILGANDGASGVGVLLELARLFQQESPSVGIDLICFDLEDWGAPEHAESVKEDTWCLGSQYWARHPHQTNYRANFGILLDMVGAPDAVFYREQISDYFAPGVVDKIVQTAEKMGYGSRFLNEIGGAVTDDHLYVNRIARIPMADIIQFSPRSETGFGAYWHTLNDNMNNISPNTLEMVGNVLVHIIYNE